MNLSKRVLKASLLITLILLSIILLIWILLLELPSIVWIAYVTGIQYGCYLLFYLGWGLICFLLKRKNILKKISRIPDWRVEMVFQDLLLMSES